MKRTSMWIIAAGGLILAMLAASYGIYRSYFYKPMPDYVLKTFYLFPGFSDGRGLIRKWNYYGYIDKQGKEAIPCRFAAAGNFSEGLARVWLDGKVGYIDPAGNPAFSSTFDMAQDFSEGYAAINSGGGFKVYEPSGIFEGGQWGFVDKSGKTVIPPAYDEVGSFKGGFASVRVKGKYGFIDKTGTVAIPPMFDYVGSFSEGLAPVKIGGKPFDNSKGSWGYIDIKGAWVIQPRFSYARSFHKGCATVLIDSVWKSIDSSGAETGNEAYTVFTEPGDVRTAVKSGGKYGYTDTQGNLVIERQFDVALPFHDDAAWVVRVDADRTVQGYIDLNGHWIYKE